VDAAEVVASHVQADRRSVVSFFFGGCPDQDTRDLKFGPGRFTFVVARIC